MQDNHQFIGNSLALDALLKGTTTRQLAGYVCPSHQDSVNAVLVGTVELQAAGDFLSWTVSRVPHPLHH